MEQIARRISFAELRKLPEGTEFTACFTDTVKHNLQPVSLKKRDARNWAERALDGIQILGTDRDGVPHAILKGTAVFSLTVAEEPVPPVSVNPEWTAEELAVIQKLAAEKDMPPSQVIRQALRCYQENIGGYSLFYAEIPRILGQHDVSAYALEAFISAARRAFHLSPQPSTALDDMNQRVEEAVARYAADA